MKRLGVLVLFDKSGIIDRYVGYLISSMQEILQKLVVVINGSVEEMFLTELAGYTDSVFVRENRGFDAGAYKDVFLKYISEKERKEYDEIVLMNDTFFGPVVPIKDVWRRLDKEQADFWGITRYPGGEIEKGERVSAHIQGYFLVIRKRMLCSREFIRFWENISYPRDLREAVKEFEIKFTEYFEENGFYGRALTDLGKSPFPVREGENPYLYNSFQLIKKAWVPFFKKKSLLFQNPGYSNALDALEYLEAYLDYDVRLLWENIFRLCKEGYFKSVFSYWELEKFYYGHKRIFIYGAGNRGRKMQRYFRYRKWKYECFLVSRKESVDGDCKDYREVTIEPEDGIILALGEGNLDAVLEQIEKNHSGDQLLLPERLQEG